MDEARAIPPVRMTPRSQETARKPDTFAAALNAPSPHAPVSAVVPDELRLVPVNPTFEQQDRALHDLGTPSPKESKQWLREFYSAMVRNAPDLSHVQRDAASGEQGISRSLLEQAVELFDLDDEANNPGTDAYTWLKLAREHLATPVTRPDGDVVEALRAIAEGYPVEGRDDRYIVVENPNFRPDNGEDPKLVIDTWAALTPPRDLATAPGGEPHCWFMGRDDGNSAGPFDTEQQGRDWAAMSGYEYADWQPFPLYRQPTPSAPPADAGLVEALRQIAAERRRQVEVEGWTPKHDDSHEAGEMARAAASYAALSGSKGAWSAPAYQASWPPTTTDGSLWPWDMSWWKPKDPRRDLIRAGALIVAEIERLDRAALARASSRDGGQDNG